MIGSKTKNKKPNLLVNNPNIVPKPAYWLAYFPSTLLETTVEPLSSFKVYNLLPSPLKTDLI